MNAEYSFENFVVVASNLAAFWAAAALAAGGEGSILVLDGASPCGKTHLLHAVGREVARSGARVVATTGEGVFRHITERLARRSGAPDCTADARLLLVDDMHYLRGKATAQQLAAVETVVLLRCGGRMAITCADFKKDLPEFARALRKTGVSVTMRRMRRPASKEIRAILKGHFAAEQPPVDARVFRDAVAVAGRNVRGAIGVVIGHITRRQLGNGREDGSGLRRTRRRSDRSGRPRDSSSKPGS